MTNIGDVLWNSIMDDFADDVTTNGVITIGGSGTSAVIDFENDSDWFAITVTAGQILRFDAIGITNMFSSRIVLWSPDGNEELAFSTSYSNEPYQFLDYEFETTGTFFIQITSAVQSDSDYTVTANEVFDDFSDDVSTAGIIAVDGVTSGRIDFELDADWFRLDVANDGDIFNFEGQSVDSTLFNVSLEVFDANGNSLTTSFFQGFQGNDSAEIGYRFTTAGTYYLGFATTSFEGSYEIITTQITDDFANDISTDQLLPNTEEVLSGELQYSGDQDFFAFDITTAGEIRQFILTRIESAFAIPTMSIYDSNGDLLISTIFRGGNQTIYDFGFSDPGRYYIEVSDQAFDLLHSYTLSANVVGTDDYLDNTNTSGVLTIDGGPVSGDIEFETDRDWFEINVSQDNQHVQFDFTTNQAVAIAIYTAAGELIRTLTYESIFGPQFNLDHIFDEAGQYFIEFDYLDFQGAVGEYTLEALTPTNITSLTSDNNSFMGDNNNDRVDGLAGDDDLAGGAGDDLLLGGAGADTLSGGDGQDILNGGEGNDILRGEDGADQLNGGDGNDQLFGGGNVDNLFGGDGDDRLEGGDRNDIINGGQGIDVAVYSGPQAENYQFTVNQFGVLLNNDVSNTDGTGPITFHTVFGVDTLIDIEIIDFGGTLLFLTDPTASVFTDEIDILFGTDANDNVNAQGGADIIYGRLGDDTIFGEAGDDILYAGLGDDTLSGGNGNDFLDGADGADSLLGGNGNDQLYGGSGNDILRSGDGHDLLEGGSGADVLDGGAGNDIADYRTSYTGAAVNINLSTGVSFGGDAEGDTLLNIENVNGTAGNDTLIGDEGDNILQGFFGADIIDGGDGNDTASYVDSGLSAVFVNLQNGTASNGPAEGDVLISIENIIGGQIEDVLTGDDNDNVIEGLSGGDQIDGGLGNDTSSYSLSTGAVSVNLSTGEAAGFDAFRDRLINIENLSGSTFDDFLTGDDRANVLTGIAGNDTLLGDAATSLTLASAEGQLFRAYQAVFDRSPDAGGFNAFLTEMRLGNTTQEAVIAEFVTSSEFQTTYGTLSNQAFVEQLYRNVLDREGDSAGIAAFTASIDGGTSRAAVVTEFANSAEFVQLMTLPSAAFAINVIIDPAEAQVFRIYQAVFQRAPDEGGFTAFTNSIQGEVLTVEAITAEFVASAEFQNTYGNLENAAFVDLLFTNVLPGNTDTQGRANFTEALDAGTLTRAEMVAEFVNSFEFVQRMEGPAAEFVAGTYSGSGDTLIGGTGNDVLFGGRGADNFVFDTQGGGNDIVLDFTAGTDILDLGSNAAFDSFVEIMAAATQVGQDTIFDFGDDNTLTLKGVIASELTEADFGLLMV